LKWIYSVLEKSSSYRNCCFEEPQLGEHCKSHSF